MSSFEKMSLGYSNLWAKMTVKPEAVATARAYVAKLVAHQSRYEAVANKFGCPWWFVAIIHLMESNADFTKHLHNGDSLTARTVHAPEGRPAAGSPPFTWEESAEDALRIKQIDQVKEWSIPRALYEFERYNGFGYEGKINSPYLWAKTSLEEKGRYIADHVWDPTAVSKQWGAAAILRAMVDAKLVESKKDPMVELKDFLTQFVRIAPTLVTVIAGPVPGLAVKALAEALTNEPTIDTGNTLVPADPKIVADKLEGSPLTSIISVIQAAEQIVQMVAHTSLPTPVALPAPVVVPPVVVAPTETVTTVEAVPPTPDSFNALDRLFPSLIGWKTYIGAGIYIAANIGMILAPTVVTPDVLHIATWIAGGFAGAGLLSKIDRYIAIFKPAAKTTTVKQL
jgi:lysozyme family protein